MSKIVRKVLNAMCTKRKKKKLGLDDTNQWRCSLKDGSLGLGASGSVIIFKKKKVHTVFVALVIRNS